MFSWATKQIQSTLSTVAGTAEPIYGPDALHPVTKTIADINGDHKTITTKEDLKWLALDFTNLETQTFYFCMDNGVLGLVQAIYSNVVGVHITTQFSLKLFHPPNADGSRNSAPPVWSTRAVENQVFDEDQYNFYADDLAIELSEDGNSFTIKSIVDPEIAVDLKFTRKSPGFKIGKDGRTGFGWDAANPWGFLRHVFWPRCHVEGSVVVKGERWWAEEVAGKGFLSMAIQAMKPHHAASKWNVLNFQGPNVSAIMMEFTTPPSYGGQTVNVSGIVDDNEIIVASAAGDSSFPAIQRDKEVEWDEPTKFKYTFRGKDGKGRDVLATLEADAGPRLDRVDVLKEVPAFVKKIVSGAAGTRPYIYQYTAKQKLKLKIGDEPEREEEGILYSEVSVISE
ncbi:oxidative stress survival, Svf1-like protein [Peziza echinospora]|nr:oxidative stress survival, Svf1-like protein [Peziza echinospora]